VAGRAALLPEHLKWLDDRGIPASLAEKFGLSSAVRSFEQEDGTYEKAQAISFPVVEYGKLVNHKYRRTSKKQHAIDKGGALVLLNHDCLLEESDRPVVIAEGEWDLLTADMMGWRAVSPPNGTPEKPAEDVINDKRYDYIWRSRELLNRVKRFIIAVDDDKAGHALRHDLIALLGPERCSFIESYGADCKDLNDTLVHYGKEAVAELLNKAKSVPVKGLYRLGDFPHPPPTTSLSVGIAGLDDHFKLTLGTFSVISGWAGHGKTSLLMRMLANLMQSGVSVALGSFETLPRPILERRMRACIYGCGEIGPKANEPGPADELLAKRLSVIAHTARDEDTELDLEYIIELAKIAVLRDGVRLLVLDPWNEIEHKRGADETETEYTGRAIRMLKRFAVNYECAVWLVAHPRKPHSDGSPKPPSLYDLAGSAHFANKADYGLIIHRDDMGGTQIEARVVKVRMGLPGRPGRVRLNWDQSLSDYREAQ